MEAITIPGSHGSLSKAGKVKFQQTPKVEKMKVRKKPIPKVRNKKNYIKRVIIPMAEQQLKESKIREPTRRDLRMFVKGIMKTMLKR